jgi:hypothetical protein
MTTKFVSQPQVCVDTSFASVVYDALVTVNIKLVYVESTVKHYATWMEKKCIKLIYVKIKFKLQQLLLLESYQKISGQYVLPVFPNPMNDI